MHVIVSGTASGIGLAIAKKFLDAGHSVTGFDLCRSAIDHPRYRHVAADIRSASAEGTPGVYRYEYASSVSSTA